MTVAALDTYRRHAELYGPELVLETAADDLDERELAELRGYVGHLQPTKRWHKGRWQDGRPSSQVPRTACLGVRLGNRAQVLSAAWTPAIETVAGAKRSAATARVGSR